MIGHKIEIKLKGQNIVGNVHAICKAHNCQVVTVEHNDIITASLTTDDPVNFFNLGRSWKHFFGVDNIYFAR